MFSSRALLRMKSNVYLTILLAEMHSVHLVSFCGDERGCQCGPPPIVSGLESASICAAHPMDIRRL